MSHVVRFGSVVLTLLILLAFAPLLLRAAPASESTSSDDVLPKGSVWAGHITGDDRRAGAGDRELAARLRVVERDDEDFVAELMLRGRHGFALRLEGKLTKKDQLVAKVTTIVRGAWPDGTVGDTWTGQVHGDKLVLQHTNDKNLTATATLTRQPQPARDQRER